MEKYIPLNAVVAEINRRIASLESIGPENYLHDNFPEKYAMLVTLKSLKFSINTLEVKEVGLDKPFEGIKVQTSMESGSLDEVIVTTRYKAQKGEKV